MNHAQAGPVVVISLYRPSLARLQQVLAAISPQTSRLILVDDGSGAEHTPALQTLAERCGAELLVQPHNCGLAAALNRGLTHALRGGATMALLLDQDSVAPPGLLAALRQRLQALPQAAAVGPAVFDEPAQRVLPVQRLRAGRWCRLPAQGDQPLCCDLLICSGMLLRLAAWQHIGGFDERLWVDSIDLDWSLRARAAGWQLWLDPAWRLSHCIGDARCALPVLGRGSWTLHSPARQYLMTRNRIYLYRQPQLPRAWVRHDLPRMLWRLVLNLVLSKGARLRSLGANLRGIVDGLRGRLGAPPAGL